MGGDGAGRYLILAPFVTDPGAARRRSRPTPALSSPWREDRCRLPATVWRSSSSDGIGDAAQRDRGQQDDDLPFEALGLVEPAVPAQGVGVDAAIMRLAHRPALLGKPPLAIIGGIDFGGDDLIGLAHARRRAAGIAIGSAGGEQGAVQHPLHIDDAGADRRQFGDDLAIVGLARWRICLRRDPGFHAALEHRVNADAVLLGERAEAPCRARSAGGRSGERASCHRLRESARRTLEKRRNCAGSGSRQSRALAAHPRKLAEKLDAPVREVCIQITGSMRSIAAPQHCNWELLVQSWRTALPAPATPPPGQSARGLHDQQRGGRYRG